jgi:glycosyltransferase involved in cell wall biosynthesis
LRILLVEPYLTGSHQAWAEGYAGASQHDVRVAAHDGRFWKWRMQGAAVTLAHRISELCGDGWTPDVLFASSMTDLPALLGLARPWVGSARAALYMHENQLTYPVSPRDERNATYPMVNWMSMVAADLVLFNSEFHRRAWFDALGPFLRQFPDHRHEGVIREVAARSEVLPVGVDLARLDGPSKRSEPPMVLWNQRCEYDKGPGEFVDALLQVAGGHRFEVALAGERFVSEPSDFDRLRAAIGDRIVHDGFADDTTYRTLLRSADIVVSTARQEFFGIAITEAVYAGAFPLLPDRLVYPERLPEELHPECLHANHDSLIAKLEWALGHPGERRRIADSLHPVMAAFDWSVMAPRYDEILAAVAGPPSTLFDRLRPSDPAQFKE